MTAHDIIERLGLAPHPEGGHFRQTWVDTNAHGRPSGTCIYFLLAEGEASAWHRVDAVEIWHHYAGAPLTLRIAPTMHGPAETRTLGAALTQDQNPQVIVPAGHWQTARSQGDWTLVGCTVSPGFTFDGFELAPPGLDIP